MSHRIDRSVARPDVDGGDIHTTAVFLLSFLLMGVVGLILLAGQDAKMPDLFLSQNQLVSNLLGVSRTPPKLSEVPAPTNAPVAVVLAEEEPNPEPTNAAPARKTTVKVANTGGTGVYVRRTTDMADKLVAWPDNTVLEIVGEDKVVNGQRWRNIKDPAGNVGWVPGDYVSE